MHYKDAIIGIIIILWCSRRFCRVFVLYCLKFNNVSWNCKLSLI